MYDTDKMKEFENPCVKDVIEALMELPSDMRVAFCGTTVGFIHVDSKDNICSFDCDIDSSWYNEE